jgi:membrane protein DedA with SNARE-associated domain
MQNAEWLLFVGVLANQAGVPIPVTTWLLAAGVLAASGSLSLAAVVAGAIVASLAADLTWYGLGRWRGTGALAGLLRLLRRPAASSDRVTRVFRAHHLGFLWGARFLPELNPIAAGLAGVTGVALPRFLLHASGSALVWTGVWVGGGFLLAETVPAGLGRPDLLAAGLAAIALTAVAVGALVRWGRRPRPAGTMAAGPARPMGGSPLRPRPDGRAGAGASRAAGPPVAAPLGACLRDGARAA